MRLSDSTVLGALGTIAMTAFGWLLRLERRSGRTAARMSEHEKACEKRQDDLKDDLAEIKQALKDQAAETREHRERVSQSLHTIGVKVAVIQTRMNTPPTGDTGNYEQVTG